MSRRARAAGFALAALGCATVAAALADGYRDRVAVQYGALRPVLVASAEIPAGKILGPAELRELTEPRRVPARFVPRGAIARATDAVGRAAAAPIPVGAYLLAAQLQVPEPTGAAPRLESGRRPVQITVGGAEALTLEGPPEGMRVDVVVSEGAGAPGSSARTYIAARGVRLLALGGSGPEGGATATLALTRAEALELIEAETTARQIRLLPVESSNQG